jgi:hypothetical protein
MKIYNYGQIRISDGQILGSRHGEVKSIVFQGLRFKQSNIEDGTDSLLRNAGNRLQTDCKPRPPNIPGERISQDVGAWHLIRHIADLFFFYVFFFYFPVLFLQFPCYWASSDHPHVLQQLSNFSY